MDIRVKPLEGAELDVAIQLFRNGMVWDGNVASKADRDSLVRKGYAVRAEGYQGLTGAGTLALWITPAFFKWAARYRRQTGKNPFVASVEENRNALD